MTLLKHLIAPSVLVFGFLAIFSTEVASQDLPKWNNKYHKWWWSNHSSVSDFTQSVDVLNEQINQHLNKDGIMKLSNAPYFFELVANIFCAKYFVIPYLNNKERSVEDTFKLIQELISNNVGKNLVPNFSSTINVSLLYFFAAS